jgi:type I restriction enzyme M protein
VHALFAEAADQDKSIFPPGVRIRLTDEKIYDIVEVLQDISIVDTDVDTIGQAFERFFGSVFRGELGQYFTMRMICRFMVAACDIDHQDYVIDPTAGSGGFLLETLLQVWHRIDANFSRQTEIERKKYDFAMLRVFGIEIHEILARILKINLLLHHDGHTNIEGDRSCLDVEFEKDRLKQQWKGGFDRVLGNPPFGDTVKENDVDLLGSNSLSSFEIAKGRTQVPSEHVILERGIDLLKDGGRLSFVIPDGLLNNQGELSNCPQVRNMLARRGVIEAIISLPDYAFRKSGAQNKTSILIFRKFTAAERARWNGAYRSAKQDGATDGEAIVAALKAVRYRVFLAEANFIGYTSTGQKSDKNDLYISDENGMVAADQSGSILGEMQKFSAAPDAYAGQTQPYCMGVDIVDLWTSHHSHRLDPKYFLFKREERAATPDGWVRMPISKVMKRRLDQVKPEQKPDEEVVVLTVSQTGEIRAREAGKGRTPPEWQGMYFEDMPTKWYATRAGDVVFSGIDLWKGCISVVPEEFDGALVSSEFPVYEITDQRLDPDFLSTLLRSRYYRRAFRAITTGHSNRRRTQTEDFEDLEIVFPADIEEQRRLVAAVVSARASMRNADEALRKAMLEFSDLIDQRGDELYDVEVDEPEAES